MFRLMTPADLPALQTLWAEAFGDSAEFSEMALTKFAGVNNVFVCEEDSTPVSMLLAVPVNHGSRKGAYFYGLATKKEYRGRGLMGALIEEAAKTLLTRGIGFAVLIPAGESLFGFYEKHGFARAFDLRRIERPVKRNLWAQAEFDAVTAKKLCELRQKFCPDCILLDAKEAVLVLQNLYAGGITIVSSEDGYGLYFRRENELQFIELQAEGDRAAEKLMEAAREKEVIVDRAEITVGAQQLMFTGEGAREAYGMVRFFAEPFDVSETYMRLMLDI